MTRRNYGYTLIELLAVIAIIGILAALAAISISNATKRARDAQRQRDMANVKTGLELYAQDTGAFPVGTDLYTTLAPLVPNYIKVLPKDPQKSGGWVDYSYDATADDYLLKATLEYKSSKATLPAGSKCADPITVKGNGVTATADSNKTTPCFRLTND